MRAAMILGTALMLAGCGHLPFGRRAASRGGETITYRALPTGFCLSCAGYTITLGPDGQGIFTGERNTVVVGDRRFAASLDAVRAFTSRLREYRPTGEVLMTGPPFCKIVSTDQNTVDIRWQGVEGRPPHLTFYGGCDVEKNRKMAAALFSAPSLLPIADLVGAH
ncbi:hypothetical protein [Sphingomonas bacterium]|uniref:hypothetical protein n=1 Tax=Sphingomonas bacterium TaxID=1895847 RepID=UPI0015758BBC|nr:hypothetical protein [Sphingomonas bacterium]